MEERYPTQQKIWTCPKCESTEYSEDTVTMTGKTWSRFMNIQNRKFLAVTCSKCNYTEFYKGVSKGCLLYTSPSPRDTSSSRMPSSA